MEVRVTGQWRQATGGGVGWQTPADNDRRGSNRAGENNQNKERGSRAWRDGGAMGGLPGSLGGR